MDNTIKIEKFSDKVVIHFGDGSKKLYDIVDGKIDVDALRMVQLTSVWHQEKRVKLKGFI